MRRLSSVVLNAGSETICQNCLSEEFDLFLTEGNQVLWCDQCEGKDLTLQKKDAKVIPFKLKRKEEKCLVQEKSLSP